MALPPFVTDAERRQLRLSTAEAVDMVNKVLFEERGSVKAAALSKYHGNAEPDRYAPLPVVLEIDRAAGQPMITSALAAMQGYRLVPAGQSDTQRLAISDAQAVAKEAGDVVNILLALLASDKPLSAADRHQVLKEIAEAKAVLFGLATKVGAA